MAGAGFERNLTGRHSLEFLQRGINRVPYMAPDRIRHQLRFELSRVVKAGRVDRDQFGHCCECQIDWRSTGRAKGVDFFISAVARHPPGICFACNFHIGSVRKSQIGPVASATPFLAIAALAVVLNDGLAFGFVADCAARASANICLCHYHSPPVGLVDWSSQASGRLWLGKQINAVPGFQQGFRAGQDRRPALLDAIRRPAASFELGPAD